MDSMIREAIENKKLLEYDYDGYHRITEPHVYERKDGQDAILVYQIGGGSKSGGIPNWRRMYLNEISNMTISDKTFLGRRQTPTGKHSSFDRTLMIVS